MISSNYRGGQSYPTKPSGPPQVAEDYQSDFKGSTRQLANFVARSLDTVSIGFSNDKFSLPSGRHQEGPLGGGWRYRMSADRKHLEIGQPELDQQGFPRWPNSISLTAAGDSGYRISQNVGDELFVKVRVDDNRNVRNTWVVDQCLPRGLDYPTMPQWDEIEASRREYRDPVHGLGPQFF